MKKYSLIPGALLLMLLFSCEKTENSSEINSDTLYLSCKVNGIDFLVHSQTGFGSMYKRLYKIDRSDKDSFLIGHFQEFSEGAFRIGFIEKLLLDTTFSFIDYNLTPDVIIKEQIFQPGSKVFSGILQGQEGFFIEYKETLKNEYDIEYFQNWTSYLKTYPDDALNIPVADFQPGSSCEIVHVNEVGECGFYLDVVFNCILYNTFTGDTLRLTEGKLKTIF